MRGVGVRYGAIGAFSDSVDQVIDWTDIKCLEALLGGGR
jgi:hypothetical protein